MSRIDSRQAMIDAAERIVAERGMPALTLKDVQIAANQSNKSAAKYHFGSRERLLYAVVDSRMVRVQSRRQEMLDALDRSGQDPTLTQVMEVLVRPLAAETVYRAGSRCARFLVQAVFDPALDDVVQKHLQVDSYVTTVEMLTSLCPAPPDIARWRIENVGMLLVTALAAREGYERTVEECDVIVADLVSMCVGALEAPVPSVESSEASGRK
ncbi:TetR/AcrR family transcriptional regulator [Dietzia aurantiaca]|uniref:TetR/AcrR family transcriptional regulator n=1 Tax=Dietzia aurantiaca TaxID=983873 RepID=UPI001E508630|nr:TetR/AcrR family transcriptional regulator [Dietzia aurantiaca]MCD2262269.1 TetR/AcrR family transcriptional regulator [Dietzia aurantiaca]